LQPETYYQKQMNSEDWLIFCAFIATHRHMNHFSSLTLQAYNLVSITCKPYRLFP